MNNKITEIKNTVCFGKSLQSCLTLCDPMDYSPPGSSVHGILQARILEWVATSFSRKSSGTQRLNPQLLHWQVDSLPLSHLGRSHKEYQFSSVQSLSCVRLFATPWIAARQASVSISNSRSSLKLTSIASLIPSSHLILCHPLLLLPPIPPSISLFQWVNSLHEVAKVLEFKL